MSRVKPDSCAMVMTADPPSLDTPGLRVRPVEQLLPQTTPPREERDLGAEALERWQAGAPARERERRKARRIHTLGERLDSAVLALRTASTVSASPVGRSSKSADRGGDPGPPKAQTPQIETQLQIVEYQVEQIEAILDAERRHALACNPLTMTTREKDAAIWRLAGLTNAEVARAAPDLARSAYEVRRAREREAIRRLATIDSRGRVTGRIDRDEAPYDPDAISERTSEAGESGVLATGRRGEVAA